jgi:hypothetical protein
MLKCNSLKAGDYYFAVDCLWNDIVDDDPGFKDMIVNFYCS